MSFDKGNTSNDEKELIILRNAVDRIEKGMGSRLLKSESVIEIITILESFLRKKQLICYGGTAINNILPHQSRFYNKDVELPDYDFFSPNPIQHVKELADIYAKAGFIEIEAKSGMHHGTYKLYVNFMPIADITYLIPEIFNSIKTHAIRMDGILYAPPDYLRMSMYLELSRPRGDVSRWEKVLKRLMLLNKHYPLKKQKCIEEFSRGYEGTQDPVVIYNTIRDTASNQGLVLFGGFAMDLYKRYFPKAKHDLFAENNPDFDILADDPQKATTIIQERLTQEGVTGIKVLKKAAIGEIISVHYEIIVDEDTVAFIYQPSACHSYNTISIGGRKLNIASIDTMLSMYMAFSYIDRPYYNKDRIMCMANYLFEVQMRNRFKQTGLLRRFGTECYGYQTTLEDIRSLKSKKFRELNKKDKEYEEWFMKYTPGGAHKVRTKKASSTAKVSGSKGSGSKGSRSKGSRSKVSGSKVSRSKVSGSKVSRPKTGSKVSRSKPMSKPRSTK